MKKWLSVVCVITILGAILGCSGKESSININPNINHDALVWHTITLDVYRIENVYSVIITEDEEVVKTVDFSTDREASNIVGLELIEIDDIRFFLGKSLDSIEEQFGPIHTETGSGFYIPSYITTDGYLIKLWERDYVVYSASRIDLFTGEGIENYSLDDN